MDVSCNLTAGDDTYISLDDYITRSPYQAGGLKYTSFTIPKDYYSSSYEGRSVEVFLDTSDYFTLNLDKEYNLKMYYMYSYPLVTRVFVSVDIYDNSNNLTNMILLYSKDLPVSNYWKKFDIDLNFILSKTDVPTGGYKCRFRFEFVQEFYNSYPNANGLGDCCIFISDNIVIENLDDNSGWFQKIIDAIKSLPEKIGQFFTNLGNQIGDFFTELGNKVTELKNSIKSFFDNLTNNLKQWFKDVGNWFSELGDRIQQFFVDLGEDIGEFFTMLKNYILYFKHPVTLNSDGVLVDEHGKPIYNNPFDDVTDKFKTTVNGWIDTVKGFIDNIDSSSDSVSEWIVTGSGMINKLFNAVPVLLVLAGFGCAFIVIRKVVGR